MACVRVPWLYTKGIVYNPCGGMVLMVIICNITNGTFRPVAIAEATAVAPFTNMV